MSEAIVTAWPNVAWRRARDARTIRVQARLRWEDRDPTWDHARQVADDLWPTDPARADWAVFWARNR